MKKNLRHIFTLIFFFWQSTIAFTQFVWPGDVNDNGVVNGIDVLYLGVAFGTTGPERDDDDDDWSAHDLGDFWTQNFFDGINYAYADCRGNGEIDGGDLNSIRDNFFLTHGTLVPDTYSIGVEGSAPQVSLLPQVLNVGLDQTILIDVRLGTVDIPVEDFYGIAIAMKYNPDFDLNGEEWHFEEAEDAWFDPSNSAEDLLVVDEGLGIIELAITRTDQQTVSGAGKLGELSIVIHDIIFGLQADTLNLEIESIRMIDKDFNTLSVAADSTYVIISRKDTKTTAATVNIEDNIAIEVYPNPIIGDVFTIQSDYVITHIELSDFTGRNTLLSASPRPNSNVMTISTTDLRKLQPQLCLLKVFTEKGLIIKKIIIP